MLATYNQTPNHIKVTIVGRDRGIRIRFRQISYFWINQEILIKVCLECEYHSSILGIISLSDSVKEIH